MSLFKFKMKNFLTPYLFIVRDAFSIIYRVIRQLNVENDFILDVEGTNWKKWTQRMFVQLDMSEVKL